MKALRYLSILCMLLVVTSFNSCKDDDEKITTGVTGQSWLENKPLEITAGEELVVSFNANDDWTATTNSNWCNILDKAGKAGQSTVRILVATTTDKPRTASITIRVKGYDSTSFQISQNQNGGSTSEDMEINIKVDQYLRDMYLWNDEYKTLKLDYTNNYTVFFYEALQSMKTNTLDKKPNADGYYKLFSSINKKTKISSTRSTKIVNKELEYSYGIISLMSVFYADEFSDEFHVQGVYPNSPAALAGIKRGTIITQIDGQKITENNASKLYLSLLKPTTLSTTQITAQNIGEAPQTFSLSSKAMFTSPIIMKQVREINGHRIGYLVYSRFDAGFDDELFEAFKFFKTQNVSDLILDLRYNSGGSIWSANLISSCIAGKTHKSDVFCSLRYNAERMKQNNNQLYNELFMYTNYPNLGTSLADGDLGLKHICCIVSGETASASELIINSLRGIDIEVTLIGTTTEGKNVGMEITTFEVEGNSYELAPITFQVYNAKGFGDYERGFKPDFELEEGDFGYYYDYGTDNEFLYAAAIKQITGVNILPPNTRSIKKSNIGKIIKMPEVFSPGRDGIIMLPLE